MSAYTEQEELERFKAWWKNYGNSLIAGVVLGVALLAGNKYWQDYRETQLARASDLYAEFLEDVKKRDLKTAREKAQRLAEDHGMSPYAALGSLVMARHEIEAGDKAEAQRRLETALDRAQDAATEHAARLALARLLLDEKKNDAALALLEVRDRTGFESEYEELKGDIYGAQGKREQARAAYAAAMKSLAPASAYRSVLGMKLDDLGGAPSP